MTVRGQIVSRDGPLDSASVTLVNTKGEYLGEGVKADRMGKFAITSTFLRDNYLLVTYAGMEPLMIDPADYTGTEYKEIFLFPSLLDPVIVTPGQNEFSHWWALVLIAAGGVYLANKKKKKRSTRTKRKK
jgi:hypothetical protein